MKKLLITGALALSVLSFAKSTNEKKEVNE